MSSKELIPRWSACMTVLNQILLNLPLRIELPSTSDAEQFTKLIDALKRTLLLLDEEPIVSSVDEAGRHMLLDGIGELLLTEEQLQFLGFAEEEASEKVEEWRYHAVSRLLDNASASLILASEALEA